MHETTREYGTRGAPMPSLDSRPLKGGTPLNHSANISVIFHTTQGRYTPRRVVQAYIPLDIQNQALVIQSLPNTRQSSAIRHLTAIPAQFVNTRPAIYRTRLTRRAVRRPIALGLHHHPGLHWDCDPPAIGAVKFKQDRRPL